MSRLRGTLQRLAAERRNALVVYLTEGDPSPRETVDIAAAAAGAGADILELGVPFSDPSADGVVIQEAMQRALRAGGGLDSALATVAALRARGVDTPVVLFGYYNPIFVRGVDRFAGQAAAAGADAVLAVDLPIDEAAELHAPLRAAGLDLIPLVAPTSGRARIEKIRAIDPPFVYYISMTGITGAAFAQASVSAERIAEVRAAAGAPVAVGFGIKTPADAAAVAAYADGVVVGSAVVRRILEAAPGRAAAAVGELVAALRAGIDGVR